MHNLSRQLIRSCTRGALLPALAGLLLGACATSPENTFEAPVFPLPPDPARFTWERTLISSADVEVMTDMQRFQAFATGVGKEARGLGKPFSVAVHRGRVYVTDTVQRMVHLFDIPGQKYTTFGTEGAGQLAKPMGVDIADNGEVFVSDVTAQRVVVFDPDGNFLRAFGGRDVLSRPSGVAVNADATRAYVIDTGGIDPEQRVFHRLTIFDAQSGELLRTVGTRGEEPGQFNLAKQIAIDHAGNVYVADTFNFRVQKFDPEGNFLMAFGENGRRFGQFSHPKGIAVDNDGNIYVTDTAFSNFQIFDPNGQLLLFIGDRSHRNQPNAYQLIAGIDVDENGRIYAVDQFFRKVEVYRPIDLPEKEGYAADLRE